MRDLLTGKNIVVTGADRGLGASVVKICLEQGANVWACCYKEDESPEFVAQNTAWVKTVRLDLTDSASIREAFDTIRADKLPVEGLVNNAGVMLTAIFQMSRESDLRNQFEVNFFGPYLFTQMVCKLMARQKAGSIVTVSSTNALDANKGKSIYGASKAALISFTKSLANEMGALGIRANCIAPSAIKTPLLEAVSEDALKALVENCALGRVAEADEVANVIAFLLSDLSSYVTGQCIRVDGGLFA